MVRVEQARCLWLWIHVLLGAVWISATSARASDLLGFSFELPCLELSVREADFVAVVEVIAGGGEETKDSLVKRVRIREVLKGSGSGDLDVICPSTPSRFDPRKPPEREIVFLRTQGEPKPRLELGISLSSGNRVRTADLRLVFDESELKAAIRDEVARAAAGKACILLPCPILDDYLLSRREWHIIVPVDLITFPLAERLAKDADPSIRHAAASALELLRSKEADALLLQLLKDPFVLTSRDAAGTTLCRLYPVRGAAWRALQATGVPAPRTVIWEPDHLFRPVRLKPAAWIPLAGLAGLAVLYRIVRGAGRWRPIPLRITRRLCHASVAMALVCMLLWLLSFWRIDIIAAGAGAERTEICSSRGRFAIAHFSLFYGSASRPGIGWATFSCADGWGEVWAFPLRADYGESKRFLGLFRSARASSNSCIYDWCSLTLPYPLLAVVPLLFAFTLHLAAARILRPQSQVCWTCGYDMRATPERCPECGTAIPGDVPTPARVLKQLREQEREEQEMHQAEEKYHESLAGALEQMTKKDEP